MAQNNSVWTALPHGISTDGKSLKLSVFISPYYEEGLDIDYKATVWANWPQYHLLEKLPLISENR